MTKLIVVETYTPCRCHTIVTARHPDRRYYLFMFVRSPHNINFGDTILADSTCDERSRVENVYLYRGPGLIYHLILDDFPPYMIQKLITDRVTAGLDNHNSAEVED